MLTLTIRVTNYILSAKILTLQLNITLRSDPILATSIHSLVSGRATFVSPFPARFYLPILFT